MEFKDFSEQLLTDLRPILTGMTLEIRDVPKLQGESYTGLSVSPNGSDFAAMVNLEDYYRQLQGGASYPVVLAQVEKSCRYAVSRAPNIDVTCFLDYDSAKSYLTVQLIPVKGNEEQLKEVPHRMIADLALVYRLQISETEEGLSSVLINNQMIRNYGITEAQLNHDALENAPLLHPATLRNMADVLRDMTNGMINPEPSPMWVATMDGGVQGAGVIAFPGFLEQVSQQLGGDFYVLPSSQHEVIIVSADDSLTRQELEGIVRSVNATELQPEDKLSDNVYHYDSYGQLLELASDYEARTEPRTITALRLEPNAFPETMELYSDRDSLEYAVGGTIEEHYLDDSAVLLCSEDAQDVGAHKNRALRDRSGAITEVIAGTAVIVGVENGAYKSLSSEQLQQFEQTFHSPELFMKTSKGLTAMPIPDEVVKDLVKNAGRQSKDLGREF